MCVGCGMGDGVGDVGFWIEGFGDGVWRLRFSPATIAHLRRRRRRRRSPKFLLPRFPPLICSYSRTQDPNLFSGIV